MDSTEIFTKENSLSHSLIVENKETVKRTVA